jgi:hypothetical protein
MFCPRAKPHHKEITTKVEDYIRLKYKKEVSISPWFYTGESSPEIETKQPSKIKVSKTLG